MRCCARPTCCTTSPCPQFRVKMDLVPGLVTYQWFTPTKAGHVRDPVRRALRRPVTSPCAARSWSTSPPPTRHGSRRNRRSRQRRRDRRGNATAGAANYAVCSACHGAQGEGNQQLNAPNLAGLDGWYIRRQIHNYQQRIRGTDKGDQFGVQMAPMANIVADPATLENVIAHIATLPNKPAPADDHGRCPTRSQAVPDLRAMPRRQRRRHVGHERAAADGAQRLVPEAPARVLQERRTGQAPRRPLRRTDGLDGRRARSAITPSTTSSPTSTRCTKRTNAIELRKEESSWHT